MINTDDVTLDTLAGDWRILQLRTGHRFSADDLLTENTSSPAVRMQSGFDSCTDLCQYTLQAVPSAPVTQARWTAAVTLYLKKGGSYVPDQHV